METSSNNMGGTSPHRGGRDEGSVGNRLSEKTADMREDVREYGKKAKDVAQEKVGKLQEQGREQIKRVSNEIKGHPISSFFIAAGIGLLMGYMFRGESH